MSTIDLIAPISYEQLTEKQLRFVCALVLSGMEEEAIWTRCFVRFTGIVPMGEKDDRYYFKKRHVKGLFSLPMEAANEFIRTMSFLTRNHVGIRPLAKIKGFQPVQAQWEDVIFLQYLDAENYYQAYLHTKDEKYLNKLLATLYLKPDESYDNDGTIARQSKISRCTPVEKTSCLLWVMGVKEYFSRKWPDLFAPAHSVGDAAPDMYAIIQNQMRVLTDGDITKRENVLSALAWDALDELNAQVSEARKIKTEI